MSIAHLILMSLAHLFPFMYICIYVIQCVVWHKEIKNLKSERISYKDIRYSAYVIFFAQHVKCTLIKIS